MINHDTIEPFLIGKGGGSAYGGKWKPSKPADEKFIGKPGEVKQSFTKKGDLYETHIGPDGKVDSETHYSDHGTPKFHDNPHTHFIGGNSPTGTLVATGRVRVVVQIGPLSGGINQRFFQDQIIV